MAGWVFGQRGEADASYANFAGQLRPGVAA
jgi:hypothetical protein